MDIINDIMSIEPIQIIFNILIIALGLTIGLAIGNYWFKVYICKGPDSNIVAKEIHVDADGKKFKWVPKICVCPISYSMNKLRDPNYIDPNH
jgi:hypothetical protein